MDKYLCPYCGGELRKDGKNSAKHNPKQKYKCKQCKRHTVDPVTNYDFEIVSENIRLAKKTQKHQDTNRIERKAFREHARRENAYTEYTKELINILGEHKFHQTVKFPNDTGGINAGIIQLSDLHFNELVDLPHNTYSFTMASKRLYRLAQEAKKVFAVNHVDDVLIACTGDFMNSDRRLDELLSNATNRSKATFLAVDILSQFISDINENFSVSVASVTGNEGRVEKEPGWSDAMATHNYDWTIHNMLAMRFKDTDVQFIHGDPVELVVDVNGQNILLLHGHSIGAKSNLTDIVTKIVGKYAARGITIKYVMFGHVHEASVCDIYSRSSSLVGANAYSEYGLNLLSRASQNVFVVDSLGNITGTKIDLQFVPDRMYDIDEMLASYNAKSESKLHPHTVIHQITI